MNIKLIYRIPLAIIFLIELIFKDLKNIFFNQKKKFNEKGFQILENFFSPEEILELDEIDQKLRSRLIQSDSSGSLRIYDFHNEFEISEKIKEKLFEFVSQFMNIRSKKIMETHYQVSLPSTSSPIGFGWHVDDYDSIIKFFYFPTKVDCTNGPLKIIEGTARYQNYYQAFKWLVFRRTFKDQYYSDTEISKSLLRNEKKLILKKNSLVAVDTSSLHSSSILEDGERRVMVFSFKSGR